VVPLRPSFSNLSDGNPLRKAGIIIIIIIIIIIDHSEAIPQHEAHG